MTEQEIKALLQEVGDLYRKGQFDQAIEIWRRIKREDSSEWYAKAQFNLGVILGEQGDSAGAIAAYRSIKREDSPETYAMAQVNLGAALGKQGDTEGAIAACRNVTREDLREQYAKAQVNLGVALAKQGKTDEAIDTFRNIQPEDSKEPYAKAQLSLGMILEARGDTEGAIAAYRNITREDSRELYAKAQMNLGVTLEAQGDTEGAIAAYRKITRKDSSELYAMAQFNIVLLSPEENNIKEAKQALSNIRPIFYYESESLLKILNCPPGSRSNLRAVYDAIVSIITTLFISSGGGMAGENPLKVAHYTRPSTAGLLIAGDSAKASPLRLSTVKNTNDPTEGKILYGYLHKSCGLLSGVLDAEQESDSQALAAFISCFTFNHDSLNQFRLYGKEDGLEASGVSLVFEKHFFSAADPFAIMTAASEREAITANNAIEDSSPAQPDKNTREKLDKLPLYRCIYLDPQSGYVSIAHRDKVTFYAEAWYGKKTAAHQDICKEAERRWKEYQTEIDRLTEKVKDDLSKLSEKIKAVAKDAENDVLQTLVFILQPLRYLVKHVAFQEEQECRMVYIIGDLLKDERIRTDWGAKQMYLEYAAPVRNSLDKIYLSPGAEPYADFFKRELPHLAKKGGIRRSQNPFRNK